MSYLANRHDVVVIAMSENCQYCNHDWLRDYSFGDSTVYCDRCHAKWYCSIGWDWENLWHTII